MRGSILVVVAALASPAAADKLKAPTCRDPVANRPAPKSVSDVDWCNHDFHIGKGPLRRGHTELHLYGDTGPHDTITTSLRGVVYGDLDGDGKREAAVVLETSTWAGDHRVPSSRWTVYVFDVKSAAPHRLGSVDASKPVHEITLGKNILAVTSGTPKATVQYRRDAKGNFVDIAAPPATPPAP